VEADGHDNSEGLIEQPDSADAAGELGPNDAGRLRIDSRRALVQLVKGPYIMRDLHPRLWSFLEVDEAAIRRSLGDLFLELVIHREAGVAFARNFDTDVPGTSFFRATPLTLIDTALVLFLRLHLLQATPSRAFIGADEIIDQLKVYGSAARTDPSLTVKRIRASIEKMKKVSLLLPAGEEDRFEVSPVLGIVFDAAEVRAVRAELERLIGVSPAGVDEREQGPGDVLVTAASLKPGTDGDSRADPPTAGEWSTVSRSAGRGGGNRADVDTEDELETEAEAEL
jgi:hypothetical protein